MATYWITAADDNSRVIYNKRVTAASLELALEDVKAQVSAAHYGSICVTDEDDNEIGGVEGLLRTARAATHEQPKLVGKLLTSRVHHGLKLDLYGELDDEGYVVLDIAHAGSAVSLYELVSAAFLDSLSDWCNANLPSSEQLHRQQAAESRAEYAAIDRLAA